MVLIAASNIGVKPGYNKSKHELKNKRDSVQKENFLSSILDDSAARLDIYRYIDTKNRKNDFSPDKFEIPEAKAQEGQKETLFKKSLIPLAMAPLIVFGTIAIVTGSYRKSLNLNKELNKLGEQGLTPIARQVGLNDDQEMAAYMLVQNPSIKTYVGAIGVLAGAAFTFVSKNFIEGMKDVWVNREYARIKKHQQKQLIDIETKSFEKRYDSLYSLMAQTHKELDKADSEINKHTQAQKEDSAPAFSFNPSAKVSGIIKNINFGSNNNSQSKQETKKGNKVSNLSEVGFLAIGAGVLAGSFLLAHKSVKNLDSIVKRLNEPLTIMDNGVKRQQHVFAQANTMWGSVEGTSPTSVVHEETAWLHTWIMSIGSKSEKLAGTLFGLFSTIGALTFIGKNAVEAVKNTKVKEENTETDLQLHRDLVDIEVQNFESKKKKFIAPLVEGYKNFLKTNTSGEEQCNMRHKIFEKIETGPPYIWE